MNDVITRSARKATRLVCGGDKALTRAKRAAHRANRRSVKALLKAGVVEFDFAPRVTGREIA